MRTFLFALLLLSPNFGTRSAAHGATLNAWVNDGGEKIAREDTPLTHGRSVKSSAWDGQAAHFVAARNEMVGFNLILEAPAGASGVTVRFDRLMSPGGEISAKPATKDNVFDFVGRDIELFYLRYLPIKGLSRMHYDVYDERHAPKKFRRHFTPSDGRGVGSWKDRPDHDKAYPDICVPLALVPKFDVAAGQSQSVWVDVYVPKAASPGSYKGEIEIAGTGFTAMKVPVVLEVKNFELPDAPTAKTMMYFGYKDVNKRYTGVDWPEPNTLPATKIALVRDRHFLLAQRHRVTLFDSDEGPEAWGRDEPRSAWLPRLNGSLFTAAHGYDGPGVGVPSNLYVIGSYGSAAWKTKTGKELQQHQDAWVNWFKKNSPKTETFIYLVDESSKFAETEKMASAFKQNPGAGGDLKTFATVPLDKGVASIPTLDIYASAFSVAPRTWQESFDKAHQLGKKIFIYNGARPGSGSFAIEDEGTSLWELPWGQYKKRIDRWFVWESTYYDNYQGGTGPTNVLRQAKTFGGKPSPDPSTGEKGWNYGNGDGVLFYPGTDKAFPQESYDLAGPMASLRLKLWRRGIQDVDYLALAAKKDPIRVARLVDRMVPKALWEVGVADPKDPTWQRMDISWSSDPDVWARARGELVEIIEAKEP